METYALRRTEDNSLVRYQDFESHPGILAESKGMQWHREDIPPPPPPTAEQLRNRAKIDRSEAVYAIKVTTSTGKEFDGDEESQNRMVRAIVGLQSSGVASINWTLANNISTTVTLAELSEALVLAGQAQAALWPIEIAD